SPRLAANDAAAVALFATQVASSLEVAESIEALERANADLCAANSSLARTQEELVKRERLAALREPAATGAHQVRNPLGVLFNSIGSLRRILRAGGFASNERDAEMLLSIAEEESDRINRIVADLLDFARPNTAPLQKSSLADVIEDATAAAAADALG